MESFILSVQAILPIFLLMTLGYVLKRMHVAEKKVFDGINKLVFQIFLPVLLFSAHYMTDKQDGHRDNKNSSGLGHYHYYCKGTEAYLHENGVCPYDQPQSTQIINPTELAESKIYEPEVITAEQTVKMGWAYGITVFSAIVALGTSVGWIWERKKKNQTERA